MRGGWAVRALVRRWRRNLLTTITIALGAATVVVLTMLSTSSALRTAGSFLDDDSSTVQVTYSDASSWLIPERDLLSRIPAGDTAAAGTFVQPASNKSTVRLATSLGTRTTTGAAIATAQGMQAFGVRVTSGTALPEPAVLARDPRHVLVGTRLARDLGISPGHSIRVNGHRLFVDGLIADTGHRSLAASSITVAPETAAILGLTERIPRAVYIRVVEGRAEAMQEVLPLALSPEDPDQVTAKANTGPTRLRDRLVADSHNLITAVTIIIVAVTTLTTFATLATAVRERRREIGIWHAMGSTPNSVTRALGIEAALLGLAGATLGLVAGVICASLVVRLLGWPLVFAPWLWLVPPMGMLASLLGGLMPALLAGRIDPIELIRAT